MANEITANVKFPWGGVGPKTFLQASVHTYTTASNSGIVLGSAVCVVNGNAVLARADAPSTLATGLVSKVISTTRCEVMTAGTYVGYEKASLAVRDVLYLSPTTAGLLTAEKPSAADEVVQVVALVTAIAENETTCELELRVGGLSNSDGSALSRIADVVTGTVEGTVGVGPVTDPQATLHVLGDCAVATEYNANSAATLTLSRRKASLTNGETLGKVSFCGLESNVAPFALGSEAASLYATVSGTWVDASHVAASIYLAAVKGTVNLSTDYGVGFTLGADGTSTMPHVAIVGNINSLTDHSVLTVLGGSAVVGPSSFGSTLGVTGATTLSSTLTVAGVTTINDTLNVNGEVTADSLTVSGATSLFNTVDITSDATVTNGLLTSKKAAAPGKVRLVRYETDGNLVTANEIGAVEFYGTESQVGAYSSGNFTAAIRCISEHDDWGTTTGRRHSKLNFNLWDAVNEDPAVETTILTVALDGVGSYIQVDGAGTFLGPVTATNFPAFTGAHIYPASGVAPTGAALVLNAQEVSLASTPRAKNCVGIAIETYLGTKSSFGETPEAQLVKVAAVGDNFSGDLRGFLVCNENGPIAAGDLLCTSSVPGHLMKQDDDILRAYTVGKAMQDVVFDESGKASGVYGYIYCG